MDCVKVEHFLPDHRVKFWYLHVSAEGGKLRVLQYLLQQLRKRNFFLNNGRRPFSRLMNESIALETGRRLCWCVQLGTV